MWDDDNDDEILRQALEESRKLYEEVELPRLSQQRVNAQPLVTISDDDSCPGPSTTAPHTSEDPFKKPLPSVSRNKEDAGDEELYDGPEAEGFSFKAGQCWVYPTSDKFPIRTYQRSIVETALFHNTLVSLPTGLGKTFIAAVVMYNFYMWYPKGKIIFMAPTKPLVAQQIENCINIMGIPESHTAEMTGATHSRLRAGTWKEKRVFFLTPQVVQNDLTANICPANAVKCVVIDEAHRALGDHAYAQVIRILNSYGAHFRVLALSATPGSDLEAVQKVVNNLMISHIELRSEDSPDIVQYTHERNLELMVVDVGPTINRIRVQFVGIAAEYAQGLQQRKLLFGNMSSIPRFTILKEWENFRRERSGTMDHAAQNRINCDFAIVHTLVHGLELLQTYGLRLLLNHLKAALSKGDQAANRLSVNEELRSLMEDIENVLNPIEIDTEEGDEKKKKCLYGHPKLDRLQEVIVSHFESFQKKGEATRAIVFCEYREGVIEICDMLKNFEPLVKPVVFMGQSAGKGGKGISQKQQLEIMDKFRSGCYNTLISTSVGEEGLDIGEVDLIICFDAKNSPIRQVQRMGRTGRKRQGRIIMLVTRGKEEQKYKLGLFKKKNVKEVLLNKENLASHLLEESPSMLPAGVKPKYTERKVIAPSSKPKSNQQDLRKMFAKRSAAGGSGSHKQSTGGRAPISRTSCLSENEFEELKLLWNIQDVSNFQKIPERAEFWAKSADEIGNSDLTPTNIDLGTYIEYMRYPQRTHAVKNSSDSELLTYLLKWADDRRDSEESTTCGGLSSQVTSTQLWPSKSKKRRLPALNSKRPGRPKKNATIDFHFLPQPKENTECNKELPTPTKVKSKFIDDDDEDDAFEIPVPLPDPQQQNLRSPSSVALQSCLQPGTTMSPSFKPVQVNVVTIDSDGESDLDSSFSSGCSYMSSQVSKQNLYRDLSIALRNQSYHAEQECSVCDTLFLCKSFNKLVLERKLSKTTQSWKNVKNALEEALTLAPLVTEELLTKYHNDGNGSQRMVSLLPKLDIVVDDEMTDGLLCGGIGDLTPPIQDATSKTSTVLQNLSSVSHDINKKEASYLSVENSTHPVNDQSEKCVNVSPEKKEIENQSEISSQIEFEDTSFDFLGISKIDDLFDPPKKEEEEIKQKSYERFPADKECHLAASCQPTKFSPKPENDSTTDHSTVSSARNFGVYSTSVKKSPFTIEPEDLIPMTYQTPIKTNTLVSKQVSPILCSQALKKPSLRLRKKSAEDQISHFKVKCSPEEPHGEKRVEPIENEPSHRQEVTSSSQLNQSPDATNPLDINFDLFDDSLLSPEDGVNKGEVDEALKEAIMKKALEVKTKKPEISFTQEVAEMCERSLGGLTQVLDMYDAKEKSPALRPHQADCSSSLQKADGSIMSFSDDELNAAKIEDYHDDSSTNKACSEEDLFADCDDSIFCRINSSEKPPVTPQKNVKQQISGTEVNLEFGDSKETCDSGDNETGRQDAMFFPERSSSPVFKPSQKVKRLRLKKKEVNELKPTKQTDPEDIEPNKSLKTSLSKDTQERALSQIDFSMFGDEFSNSWLCSQNNAQSTDVPKIAGTSNCHGSGNIVEISKSSLNNKVSEFQNSQATGYYSPDDDLEEEFAKLDAARLEKKKSSTPKAMRPNSAVQQETVTHKSTGNVVARKKLSLKQKPSSYISVKKDGWISVKTKEEINFEPQQTLSKSEKFDLSDFCDDSLLDVFNDKQRKRIDISGSHHKFSDGKKKVWDQDSSKIMKRPDKTGNFEEPRSKKKLSLANKATNPTIIREESRSLTSKSGVTENSITDEVVILSSDEEVSTKPLKPRKKCLNITSSSEEGFEPAKPELFEEKKLCNSKKRKKYEFDSSMSSDSFTEVKKHSPRGDRVVERKKNNTHHSDSKTSALDLSTFCDDSLLNDLVDSDDCNGRKDVKTNQDSSGEDVFVQKTKIRAKSAAKKFRKKKGSSKRRNGFIMSEAEESEDELRLSSDGESTSLDELDSSFINDSQPDGSQSVIDIHHKYLEAVRSPVAAVGRFKIPSRLPEVDINIYSQCPDASEMDQTYANDSFCVDDEPTQYDQEISLLEMAERKLKAKRREKRKRRKALESSYDTHDDSGKNDSEEDIGVKKRRLKRIRILEETTIEDADNGCEDFEKSTTKILNEKPQFCVSDKPHIASNLINHKQNDEFAKLLDEDDLDFSFIPDIPEVLGNCINGRTELPRPSTSKFVKKAPIIQNGNLIKLSSLRSDKEQGNYQNTHFAPPQEAMPSTSSTFIQPLNEVPYSANRAPNASNTSNNPKGAELDSPSPTFIVASSRQIAQSPDVLRILRVSYRINIIPHSVPDADFIISWRLGVSRIFSSDLKDKKKLEDTVRKLKQSYLKPNLIIESDRLKLLSTLGPNKKGKKPKALAPTAADQSSTSLSPWGAPSSCVNAALLRQAGVQLLFSQNFDETARYLAKLARRESSEGHCIPAWAQNASEDVEARLMFFTRLPGINYAFALKLLSKFETLGDFLERCSGVCQIASTLGLDRETARKIHLLIKESYFMP